MSKFVQGKCPLCGGGVFVASGDWLTCSRIDCPDPTFVSEIFSKYKECNANLTDRSSKKGKQMTFQPGDIVEYATQRTVKIEIGGVVYFEDGWDSYAKNLRLATPADSSVMRGFKFEGRTNGIHLTPIDGHGEITKCIFEGGGVGDWQRDGYEGGGMTFTTTPALVPKFAVGDEVKTTFGDLRTVKEIVISYRVSNGGFWIEEMLSPVCSHTHTTCDECHEQLTKEK